ncbi:NAD(P)-binding domain-containing protein [Saccharopolyspora phatthalungensis]|uniref:Cation diffusion facilitator CzcD-associated flavoprotein CzcO n=1 Tax=Saccharopolyspora phatthalungensis TaxID=664693 RepID=A0A840QGF3_9PSEU|nr:NAD(P)-binding domain-containing protein [Saccharopolyspora phatthalungensis]MBB5157828.1 cation diffusion facilitator CzcD-associated flavoprotein CzcO [Saccharopolyspora phatthalungensis]
MSDLVDVAIVGAGPYGLSLAAHLRRAGLSYRQFGLPMNLWRAHMPRGMYLKSQGFASNLSDPDGTHTLRNFCLEAGRRYADYGVPVSLENFVEYGEWFQQGRGLEVEELLVADIQQRPGRFQLTLSDGQHVDASQVVVVVGVEFFARVPGMLSDLPAELCTHSSVHDDLSGFDGQDVIVVGAGQSALETAALLHENGANARLVARAPRVAWNGKPLLPDRPLWHRMREPEAGLGSGLSTWFYSEQPKLFRHLPRSVRVDRARTALGPAGGWWLRERVEGRLPVHVGHRLEWAKATGEQVRLGVRVGGEIREFTADHIISATGYPPDLSRLPMLSHRLRSAIHTIDGTPRVGRDFESSVPGLYFAGPLVAPSHGPVMRFVYGADYAVRMMTKRLTATTARPVVVGSAG